MKKIESISHAMRTCHKNSIFVSTSQRKRIFFSKNIPSHCAKAPAGSSANFRTVRKLQQVLPQTFALCESSSRFFRKLSHCAKAPAGSSASFRTVRKLQHILPQAFALYESSNKFFRKLSHCATLFLFSFLIYFFGLIIITTGLSSSSIVSTSSFIFPLSFPWALASTN